jgi:hypothetical protein
LHCRSGYARVFALRECVERIRRIKKADGSRADKPREPSAFTNRVLGCVRIFKPWIAVKKRVVFVAAFLRKPGREMGAGLAWRKTYPRMFCATTVPYLVFVVLAGV